MSICLTCHYEYIDIQCEQAMSSFQSFAAQSAKQKFTCLSILVKP